MGLTDDIEMPKKTTAVIFFVIKTSKNMAGSRIIAVNNNMKKVLAAIDDISGNCSTGLKTAVLTFSSSSNWITTGGPVTLNDLEWKDQEASGSVDFGSAILKFVSDRTLAEFTGTSNAVIKFDNSGERHINVFSLDIAESIKSLCRDIYVINDWSPSQIAEQMKNYGVDDEFNSFL